MTVSTSVPERTHFSKKAVVPAAVRSKVWVCGRSLAGIAGSNTAVGMCACLL